MKLLQLNIYGGRYLEEITEFINTQKYDILCLQEIAGGDRFQLFSNFGDPVDTTKFPSKDCYQELEKRLPDYNSVLGRMFEDETKQHYVANGIFFRHGLEATNTVSIHMGGEDKFIAPDERSPKEQPYKAISTTIRNLETGQELDVITGHFCYLMSPYDTDQTIRYARNVYDHIKELSNPFILTGDFNVDWRTVTVNQFNDLGTNLVSQLNMKNTLNPKIHKAKHLFPEGLAVDQMFISKEIETKGFRLVRENFSDHYGLEIEFDIQQSTDKPIAMNTYFDEGGNLQDYRKK